MKIYKMIRMDIETGAVIEQSTYDYEGPIAECKGGSAGDSVDPWYNARMAKIAERQQKIAEEYYSFWQTSGQQELEAQTAQANLQLLPSQTKLQQSQMEAELGLLPLQVEFQKSLMEYNTEDLQARKPLARKYYEDAMTGINPNQKASEARAGVAQQLDAGRSAMYREASRLGADPNSARFQRNMGDQSIARARAIGGAMQSERNKAEDVNFARMDAAMQKQLGVGV